MEAGDALYGVLGDDVAAGAAALDVELFEGELDLEVAEAGGFAEVDDHGGGGAFLVGVGVEVENAGALGAQGEVVDLAAGDAADPRDSSQAGALPGARCL